MTRVRRDFGAKKHLLARASIYLTHKARRGILTITVTGLLLVCLTLFVCAVVCRTQTTAVIKSSISRISGIGWVKGYSVNFITELGEMGLGFRKHIVLSGPPIQVQMCRLVPCVIDCASFAFPHIGL